MAVEDEILKAGSSLVWKATLGALGIDHPYEEVREWEAEHPVISTLGDIAGMAAVTTKGMSLLRPTAYGKWASGLAKAENAINKPFLSKFASEAALMAPVEAGRQALGYGIQEALDLEGPGIADRSVNAIVDTLAGGLIAGGIAKIASGGKRIRLPAQLKDLSAEDSWQVNLRKAREVWKNTEDAAQRGEIEKVIWNLEGKIKNETRDNFISPLENDSTRLANLNTLMRGSDKFTSKIFAANPGVGFKSLKELDDTLEAMKAEKVLPEDWLEYSQFPRLVSAKPGRNQSFMKNTIEETLDDVGNGWRMAKERDGLYVIARKMDPEGSRWFITKTDSPGKFMPEQGALAQVVDKKAWRDPETIYAGTGNANNVLDQTLRYNEMLEGGIRARDISGSKMFEATKKGVQELGERVGLGKIAESETLGNLIDESKRNFVPTAFQFKNSPRARRIYAVAQNTIDAARRKAQSWVYGNFKMDKSSSLAGTLVKGVRGSTEGSWDKAVKALAEKSPDKFDALLKVIDDQVPYEKVLESETLRAGLGEEGMGVLKQLVDIHDGAMDELFKTAGALHIPDKNLFPLKKGHYGISHYWNGSLRQGILDERGNMVYILGGDNKKGLKKMAEGMIAEAAKEGHNWRLGEFWMKARDIDLRQEKLLNPDSYALASEFAQKYSQVHPEVHKASFFFPQTGVKGYNRAKTAEELVSNLAYSLENKYLWLAREINDRVLAKDLAVLGIDSPKTAAALEDKLSVLRGEQGIFSQLVNKAADRILAPVLGTDSASKIVSSLNKAQVHLDLGFGNMAYALANILQPITTVLPQLSLIQSCPQALAWAYDGIPLVSKSGKGMLVHQLSPMKIMWESMKLMAKPGGEEGFQEFTEWMIKRGVLSPRFIESYIGQNSGMATSISDAFKQRNYSGMITSLSTLLPSFSEQASRGYAATVGYKLFNSYYKAGLMTKEQVYDAAKKFTENTMFQFAASDRARILQGPVGQAWGLFKNWTMHYVGWQMQYLEAGLKYGAWKPYMYSNLATTMLGGMGSSEIGATLERFTEWASDEKMSELLYDRWGDGVGSSMLLYGLPGAFGFSLQGQVNSPLRDPGEEAQRFMGMVWANRLQSLWKTAEQGIEFYSTTGRNPAQDEAFRAQLARAFAPKMIYRSMQMTNDALYSLSTGTKVVGDLGKVEQLAYQYFNLPSIRISQGLEISSQIWKDKQKRATLTSKYSEAMADALSSQDGTLIYRVIERALVDGVDIQNVIDAARTRLQNEELTPLERNTDYFGVYGITAGMLGL